MVCHRAFLALAALFSFTTTPAHAALTYMVDLPLDAGSATGSITTNGTIGQLTAGDIGSYAIDVSGLLGATDQLTDANSDIYLVGTRLSADANHLYFDFTPDLGSQGYFLIQKVHFSGANYLCAANFGDVCYEGTTAVPVHVSQPSTTFGHPTGKTIIASVVSVPEPGTWAMLIVGMGLTGYAMRRRPAVRIAFA